MRTLCNAIVIIGCISVVATVTLHPLLTKALRKSRWLRVIFMVPIVIPLWFVEEIVIPTARDLWKNTTHAIRELREELRFIWHDWI